jgi:hypothetical protein
MITISYIEPCSIYSSNIEQILVAIFIALGVVLVAGLVVIPAIEEAQARSDTALERNKGQQGFVQSGGQSGGCGHTCG